MQGALRAAVAAAIALGAARAAAAGSLEPLAREYERWLDAARTPADAVAYVLAQASGFRRVDPARDAPGGVGPGDRIALVSRDRLLLLVRVGQRPLHAGFHLIGSHIDTPSLRLQPPAGAGAGAAEPALRAVRYGGAKGYHWTGIPLMLRGRVARPDGRVVAIALGDPAQHDAYRFFAHRRRPGADVYEIDGPVAGPLRERYGLSLRDLAAAEIFVVPARPARRVGLDRGLVGAHGQDDRACSFPTWRALVALDGTPAWTAMALLADREEVGSTGAAGAQSEFLSLAIEWLLRASGDRVTTPAQAFARSLALSSDVAAGVDPIFPQVHEPGAAPRLGAGPVLLGHMGHGGQIGGAQPALELAALVVRLYAQVGVPLQVGELGRVDEGGGGTIGRYLAALGMEVVDIGVPLVSMHSPFELVSPADLDGLLRADGAFYRAP